MKASAQPTASPRDPKKEFVIDFIDPLFAAAVGIGLTEGIMAETWFEAWRAPKGDEWFHLWSFGLGLLTLVASWVGYHESVRTKPLKGMVRFILDVVLVLMYALLLVRFQQFGWVLGVLVAVFFCYILWDIAKVQEYRDEYRSARSNENVSFSRFYHSQIVTAIWFGLFALLGLSYQLGLPKEWALGFAVASTFLYRIHKNWFIWAGIRTWAFGSNA